MPSRIQDRLFISLQYLVPHHALSRLTGWLAQSNWQPLKRLLIRLFARRFGVDMSEAERPDFKDYRDFNDFFTRALKPGARPLPEDPAAWVCPVDGTVSQAGHIESGRVIQAKGRDYSVTELLGGDSLQAKRFDQGRFATLYLSPRDYHRIHMPANGRLVRTTFVPGRLFSVNEATAAGVPRLFARNERLVCEFETERGPLVMVLVGAMVVASIETVWGGIEAPFQRRIRQQPFDHQTLTLERGEEMGRFRLGSTVVLLLPNGALEWSEKIVPGAGVTLGQPLE